MSQNVSFSQGYSISKFLNRFMPTPKYFIFPDCSFKSVRCHQNHCRVRVVYTAVVNEHFLNFGYQLLNFLFSEISNFKFSDKNIKLKTEEDFLLSHSHILGTGLSWGLNLFYAQFYWPLIAYIAAFMAT